MLELSPEILDDLRRGATVVVPTPQRAAALRLAYSSAQLAAGLRVWSSPDVLPWTAWLERGLDDARSRDVLVPRRLSRAEAWWLWREAVQAACSDVALLWPDSLIDSVRRAVLLLEDYGLELHDASSAETRVLLRARAHFNRRCATLAAIWSSSWSACAAYLQPRAATRLLGFAELGPARREWLERVGVRLEAAAPLDAAAGAQPPARRLEVAGFDSAELEAEAAARWCAAELRRDPGARLLLIVARLPEQRHRWLRALAQRLDYPSILDGQSAGDDSQFALEGGQALTDYALVAVALQLLVLAAAAADFEALSAVLRSPFLDSARHEARLRIDVWLRQHNVAATSPMQLAGLVERVRHELGAAAGAALQGLIDALAPSTTDGAAPAQAPASHWAQSFAAVLERVGWPGPGLRSHEQQIRVRFEELLGELASLAVTSSALSQAAALQLLRQLAARTAFEPASDDVPVTLSASLEDPIARYDAIWVAGLTADAWPQPARADPLIPWAVQAVCAMPMASPAQALRRAEQSLRQWQRATDQLTLSWSRSNGDLPCDISPLLREALVAANEATGRPVVAAPISADSAFELESWLAASSPRLEEWHDASAPIWPRDRGLPGGTRLLELQALCPFRGFAQLRLRAEPLAAPSPGIDARLRGQILHRALELFWRETRDSRTLRARTIDASRRFARDCIERSLAEAVHRVPGSIEPNSLRGEAQRDARLFEQLILWELGRGPFESEHLEWPRTLAIAGATLRLRLDRVDRLADGSLIVIDYKSGTSATFDALAERPTLPQLPAYALAAGEQTVAVAALYLAGEGLALHGTAVRSGRLPGLKPLRADRSSWAELQQRWSERLETLVQEFLSGHALAQPQPKACDRCHLQAFCRIESLGELPP